MSNPTAEKHSVDERDVAQMECMAEDCDWVGDRIEAVSDWDDPDSLHCPRCLRRLTEAEHHE